MSNLNKFPRFGRKTERGFLINRAVCNFALLKLRFITQLKFK